MIAYLHGKLQTKNAEQIIIDIHGIGYLVSIPLSTFYKLPDAGEEVRLFITTFIRETSWQLFGFWTIEEKELFEIMLGVSKIGPKLARSILSHISPEEFRSAIRAQDVSRMQAIPGIGDKTARRLILELKDKVSPKGKGEAARAGEPPSAATQAEEQAVQSSGDRMESDAVDALLSLGYNRLQAERAVNQILLREEHLSIEELIKKALNRLAG
ncbi:MAG: Holliday junction branch migration protein RuvA [bacterium]